MGYIACLLGGIMVLIIMVLWALDGVRDSLKSIDSKLDSLDNILISLEQKSEDPEH